MRETNFTHGPVFGFVLQVHFPQIWASSLVFRAVLMVVWHSRSSLFWGPRMILNDSTWFLEKPTSLRLTPKSFNYPHPSQCHPKWRSNSMRLLH